MRAYNKTSGSSNGIFLATVGGTLSKKADVEKALVVSPCMTRREMARLEVAAFMVDKVLD